MIFIFILSHLFFFLEHKIDVIGNKKKFPSSVYDNLEVLNFTFSLDIHNTAQHIQKVYHYEQSFKLSQQYIL